jgi:predicted metal-dependent hydrolase
VRESRRAKSIRLVVRATVPLEVVVPQGTRDRTVNGVLESKRGWIAEKLAVVRAVAARPAQLGLEQPGVVWLAGESLPVDRQDGRRAGAELRDGRVLVRGSAEAAPAALERWYRRQARRLILEAAELEAERLEVEFTSVGIRDQSTRWGSCSSAGHLSFSWRLVLAPREVLNYVVVHELVHLRELNHSKAFWAMVENAWPGWRRQSQWLRDHGRELRDYDPSAALRSCGMVM